MTAQRLDVTVEQGSDFTLLLEPRDEQGRPRSLVGWRAEATVRHSPDSPVVAELDTVVRPGSVRVTIPAALSATWDWRRSRYEVRLLGPQGQRERLAAGRVVLDRQL